jgi:hypothetical protein
VLLEHTYIFHSAGNWRSLSLSEQYAKNKNNKQTKTTALVAKTKNVQYQRKKGGNVVQKIKQNKNSSNGDSQVGAHIEDAVVTLLTAGNFYLPREMPTHVLNLRLKHSFTIQNASGLIVDVSPNLRDNIEVQTFTNARNLALTDVVDDYPFLNGAAAVVSVNNVIDLPHIWNDLSGNQYQKAKFHIADYPLFTFWNPLLQNGLWETFADFEDNPNDDHNWGLHRSFIHLYNGSIISLTGTITCVQDVATEKFAVMLVSFDSKLQVIGTTLSAAYTVSPYTVPATVPPPSSYFGIFLVAELDTNHLFTQYDSSTMALTVNTADQSSTFYSPVAADELNHYLATLDSCTSWSFVGCAVTVTNLAAGILSGGNVSTALVPYGSLQTIPTTPTTLYEWIQQRPYDNFDGPVANGSHASWLGEKVQDYYLRPMQDYNEAPHIVACVNAPDQAPVVTLNVRVKIVAVYEFVCYTQLVHNEICPQNVEFFNKMLGVIRLHSLSSDETLVGDNPDHMKRIKSLAKKVASNPAVRNVAKQAINMGIDRGMSFVKDVPKLMTGFL